MIEWFRQREPREQLVLALAAALTVVIVGWTFAWSPLRDGASDLHTAVEERAREVVDLRRAANLRAGAGAGGVPAVDTRNLLLLANETAGAEGLSSAITRTTPTDGGSALNVTLRDARFDRVIDWLIELEQNHGVTVASASFTHSGGAGMVNGTLRFERP